MTNPVKIGNRSIGPGFPSYLVAEVSANHDQSFERAVAIVEAAKEAGADAIKLQTYTADTITLDCNKEYFRTGEGTPWAGRTLHELYQKAQTPWEWHPRLKDVANRLGMELFSSPFDDTAVDYLEAMGVPAFKIASPELIDLPLAVRMARTGKPLIISTGMATVGEIEETLSAVRAAGATEIALLKCTSAYPAPPEDMNLRAIPFLMESFKVPVGLSDHTLGIAVPVAAVTLGGCIVEKHLTLKRSDGGPDAEFSLEPHEFRHMVDAIRTVEKALGKALVECAESEVVGRLFRRSLFVVKDIQKGDLLSTENVRSIRPGYGLAPKYISEVLGHRARVDLERGTPLRWEHIVL